MRSLLSVVLSSPFLFLRGLDEVSGYSAVEIASPPVWFKDIREAEVLSLEGSRAAALVLFGCLLTEPGKDTKVVDRCSTEDQVKPLLPPNLRTDSSPRAVIVTARSDGTSTRVSRSLGLGRGIASALSDAVRQIEEGDGRHENETASVDPEWHSVQISVVTEVNSFSMPSVNASVSQNLDAQEGESDSVALPFHPSPSSLCSGFQEGIHGIAFGPPFALGPEEMLIRGVVRKGTLGEGVRVLKEEAMLAFRSFVPSIKSLSSSEFSNEILRPHPDSLLFTFSVHTFFGDHSEPTNPLETVRLHRKSVDVRDDTLEAAVLSGVRSLSSLLSPRGRFVYRVNPWKLKQSVHQYNVLRHAGSTWAILRVYRRHPSEFRLLESAKRALQYLLKRVRSVGDPKELVVVEKGRFKLGALGLALLAVCEYTDVTGDAKFVPMAESLAQTVLAWMAPSGEFTVMEGVIEEKNGKSGVEVENVKSLYYPGEAIFGLASLSNVTRDMRWLKAAARAADWIADVRDAKLKADEFPHDHWLLYGIAEIHKTLPDEGRRRHAKKVVDAILNAQIRTDTENPDFVGGWLVNGPVPSTNPAACRVEGLSAIHDIFLDEEGREAGGAGKGMTSRIREGILRGADFVLRMQNGRESSLALSSESASLMRGAWPTSVLNPWLQIDNTQHALCACMGAQKVLFVSN
uniref:Uncharacterized protein n=1 Tax=Chromera velia CCMP2878 TaxID=1169474 RepID=A0A0G4GT22_9ALVE|eukprot:Cvel_5175.t1-p1 / transcript=Cvel_5175.t1 / gene=Cvel_5175 / organism=Chromera_velia_CCMP2878 / gene_product=hypothetical protein / transcript_product=hypothetical protein / location=Cvel_scaffold237:83107-86814(+) / protein_length=686 / sequence_SO=supercontig / SO=protein_coding / is_pseudo=false